MEQVGNECFEAETLKCELKNSKFILNFVPGYITHTKINNIEKPRIINNGYYDLCIINNGYDWFGLYSDDEKYALTIMLDNNGNII